MSNASAPLLSNLPAVGEALQAESCQQLIADFGEGLFKFELRNLLAEIRQAVLAGERCDIPALDEIASILDRKSVV